MHLQSINPANGQPINTYEVMNESVVENALQGAETSFRFWRDQDIERRCEHLRKIAEKLLDRRDQCAAIITAEMGKPITESRGEVEKCAKVCEYYADNAPKFLADEVVDDGSPRKLVRTLPSGTVLAVMPWNFPFWQVFRFVAPNLALGNTCLVKHASNVSGCALMIEQIMQEAELPEGLFRSLLIPSDRVQAIIEDSRVCAVTLTGSTGAGRAVASAAGQALKKTVLELGGSDPYIILEDADVEEAASICAQSRLINGGQSCISAKRFIVVESLRREFETALATKMGETEIGDPIKESTTLGPLARLDFRHALHEQVVASRDAGAQVILGGEPDSGVGAYYPPTVLTGVRPGMVAYEQELFGPVASIIGVANEAQALEVANDSGYGLGAAIFSRDTDKALRLSEKVESGACFINDFVKSSPELPFGGVKNSGYGRELSHYGIKEFANQQTVVVT